MHPFQVDSTFSRSSSAMRFMASWLVIIGLLTGCSPQSSQVSRDDELPELTTVATSEVARLAKAVDEPVIVESSVLHGCVRWAHLARHAARDGGPDRCRK